MEFPREIQAIINQYAKPYGTRRDWRTCKRQEARAIYLLNRDSLHTISDQIGMEWFDIIKGWSMYARLTHYNAGPASEEGQTTIRLRRTTRNINHLP
jgi:hypothetical protein